jgi:DNA repair exonuclease SbcCD nuclease subunit
MTTVLAIGDPHFQTTNVPEVDLFIERIVAVAEERKPDFIICLGDLLHTHATLDTTPLNKAYEFAQKLKVIAPMYILVGNHDYINNQQFLTSNHWMNAMKDWDSMTIVDTVQHLTTDDAHLVLCPYVPNGKFKEALNTSDEDWTDANMIFAHQEFFGCKMGAIVSVDGDKWTDTNPQVVSGHIHDKQTPQPNVYYTGSSMQHAFGESGKKTVAFITVESSRHKVDEINLELPKKKIVYMDVEALDDYVLPETDDKIKVTVSGSYDEFKAIKKTKKYKKLVKKGIKVVFKPKKVKQTDAGQPEITATDFDNILTEIVTHQQDPYLQQAFELVVHSKQIDEDVMFL